LTSGGAVREDVWVEACLILRFVSLERISEKSLGFSELVPVKVGSFDVAQSLWLTGTDENHVGRDEIVAFKAHYIANSDVFPFSIHKG
jgi:hypothetical protein